MADTLIVDTKRVYEPHKSSEPLSITVEGQESIFWIRDGQRKMPGTTTKLILRKEKNPWDEMTEKEKVAYPFVKKECERIENKIRMGDVTVESIREFCEMEIKVLQTEWVDMDCKGLTDLTVREKEIIIKARIKNYKEILSVFKKADNFKKEGEEKAKEIINRKVQK